MSRKLPSGRPSSPGSRPSRGAAAAALPPSDAGLRASRVRELASALVRFPSFSGLEKDAADWLFGRLGEAGLRPARLDDNVWVAFGEGPDTLLLASHLDVVPPVEGHPHPPFEPTVSGGRLWGRGAVDAKGCVAAVAVATIELVEAGWSPPGGRVIAAFTACEESGWPYNGLQALRPGLPPVSAAVVGEPTSLVPVTAQKGLLILRVQAEGRAAHAARAEHGINAVTRAARDVLRLDALRLEREHPLLGGTTATVTTIEGGTARNVVPDRCVFHVDVRTTPSYGHEELAELISGLVEGTVSVHSERFVPVETPADARVVRAACRASGREPAGSPTLSDWVFLRDLPVVKIGPGDSRLSHTADEHIGLDELAAGVELYRNLILEYFAA